MSYISLSSELLWAIESDDTIFVCQLPNGCFHNNWVVEDVKGRLEQIDVGHEIVWGVNEKKYVYTRVILGGFQLGPWIRVDLFYLTSDPEAFCLTEVSVSNDGAFVWALSTSNEVFMCQNCGSSSNVNWKFVDNETRLIHIEVGDEEVWGVNATNHILKRPVNGSGEWRSVPGEMRYISASGYRYVWGIAPNDSLYNCEMPCDNGEWQYIGENYKQIEATRNFVVGLRTDSTLFQLSNIGNVYAIHVCVVDMVVELVHMHSYIHQPL